MLVRDLERMIDERYFWIANSKNSEQRTANSKRKLCSSLNGIMNCLFELLLRFQFNWWIIIAWSKSKAKSCWKLTKKNQILLSAVVIILSSKAYFYDVVRRRERKLVIINIDIFFAIRYLPSFFQLTTYNHNGILHILCIKESFWFVCVSFDLIPSFIHFFFCNYWCQVCAQKYY